MHIHIVLTVALLLTTALPHAATSAAAAPGETKMDAQIDALFARWTKPGAPGAAIAIVRDGKLVFSRGYGLADIERAVPITSRTVFHAGSLAKQFTACAIHLLEQDGKLSLDDDMRRHLPDMPDFGKTITIRHLLQHTSGLRDSSNLLFASGWRADDVATQDDVLALMRRQRDLNFAPGTDVLYSNGGYIVLAAIVERVSGQPLSVFARQRIFEPLGMKQTRFQTHHGELAPGRALSYMPHGDEFRYMAAQRSSPGPSELLTTVEDLALWDQNTEHGRVGGKALMERMQQTGVLADGKPIEYASGLYTADYRGAKMIEHLGTMSGYAAQMSRIPARRFTVIVLANSRAVNPTAITRRVIDLYFGSELAPVPVKPPRIMPAEIKPDAASLAPLPGWYEIGPDFGIGVSIEDGQLVIQRLGGVKMRLAAAGAREFFFKDADVRFTFAAPGADGMAPQLVLHERGRQLTGRRATMPILGETDLRAIEGDYYSDELRVLYSVARQDGKLVLRHPRGQAPMQFHGARIFQAPDPAGRLNFECPAGTPCSGFRMDAGRAHGLRFRRVVLGEPQP